MRTHTIGLVALWAAVLAAFVPRVSAQAIIGHHGGLQLGVNATGNLGVTGGAPSAGTGTTVVGFRSGDLESLASGCVCEGWGVAIAGTAITGYANIGTDGGSHNLSVVNFVSDGTRATSIVDVVDVLGTGLPTLRVTHAYHPTDLPEVAAAPDFYQVDVTITNLTDVPTSGDILYRRVMDWSIEPTASRELVSMIANGLIAGTLPDYVRHLSDDGFETANPLVSHMNDVAGCGSDGTFLRCGPADHGALVDLSFPALAAGESRSFEEFYGATGNVRSAFGQLSNAGTGDVISFAFCDSTVENPNCRVDDQLPDYLQGSPFVFALGGVGGIPLVPEPDVSALWIGVFAAIVAFRGGRGVAPAFVRQKTR